MATVSWMFYCFYFSLFSLVLWLTPHAESHVTLSHICKEFVLISDWYCSTFVQNNFHVLETAKFHFIQYWTLPQPVYVWNCIQNENLSAHHVSLWVLHHWDWCDLYGHMKPCCEFECFAIFWFSVQGMRWLLVITTIICSLGTSNLI